MQLPSWLSGVHAPVLSYWVINIDPILVRLGPLAIHWYGLAYVLAISIGLWAILRYTARLGISEDQVWGIFVYTAIAGLVGGRLYYVVQQPDLVSHFLLQPYNIIAVWDGGMAFFGAIFLGSLTLFLLSRHYGFSPWIALDGGALFAAVGQIFGRFGNIINGDIVGTALGGTVNVPAATCANAPCIAFVNSAQVPWYAMVYLNPAAFHQTFIPYQPAAIYEIGLNLVILFILWQVRYVLPRIKAGYLFTLYLALYSISQIIVFFARDNDLTPFLGITGLKQAQWTGIFTLIFLVPALYLLVRRFSEPWRYTRANPVPWRAVGSVPGGKGGAPALATAAGGKVTNSAPARTASAANGSMAARGQASAPAAPPAIEMPPWEPTHPTGGALRNVFRPGSHG
ncbi:MAG TPA: prolipoprotein diacylglyceryl transferase [Ktedonobacterales bacterium]|jgi:phosphatidylglycerol:prolipoprotein diacylglycerol transferase|nr:prolipoprotein diacylglyceryl transferase [Ktedonobacterales bacterium]